MRSLLFALVITTAAACGGKSSSSSTSPGPAADDTQPADTAPADQPMAAEERATLSEADMESMMHRALAMFVALGDAADQSGGDCDQLTTLINKVLDDNAPLIADAQRYKDDAALEKYADEWMKAHNDQMMEPITKLGAVAQKCGDHPGFIAAMERFEKIDQ